MFDITDFNGISTVTIGTWLIHVLGTRPQALNWLEAWRISKFSISILNYLTNNIYRTQ